MPSLFDRPFEEDERELRSRSSSLRAGHDSVNAGPEPQQPAVPREPLTVTELTADIRAALESGFADVWVEGELSNCRLWNTGHLYFTLKDVGAQLKAVMFRSDVRRLKFKCADGQHVVARGRLPGQVEVAVAARDREASGRARGIGVGAAALFKKNIVDPQRVVGAVVESLDERDARQLAGVEAIVVGALKQADEFRQRQPQADPPPGRQRAATTSLTWRSSPRGRRTPTCWRSPALPRPCLSPPTRISASWFSDRIRFMQGSF